MYCLTNICYVCLKKKDDLISSVNSSVSVNEEFRRIIGYLAFNQPWLKTKRIILTCEECYSLLRKTYQFLKMWHKNSVLLQGYIDLLNTTPMLNTDNEAELHVHVNMKQTDINDVKREVKFEDEQRYTFQWEHNIEETEDALEDFEESLVTEIVYKKKKVAESEACPTAKYSTEMIEETDDVFINLEESFVKEENTWKREEADDTEEYPMGNNTENIEEANDIFVYSEDSFVKEDINRIREEVDDTDEYPMGNYSTESIDNESDSEISINDSSHLTDTDAAGSGFVGKQMHATNKDDLNKATKKSYKCSTCRRTFITKTEFNVHTKIHTGKKSYDCAICKKRCNQKGNLVIHMRVHTGEKPYECTTCKKCFTNSSHLIHHMRTHTGEKPYKCATCKKCFTQHSHLVLHMRTHTGDKPYECATCKNSFSQHSTLVRHIRTHTGDKPYECDTCKKCYTRRSSLVSHMLVHTGKKSV